MSIAIVTTIDTMKFEVLSFDFGAFCHLKLFLLVHNIFSFLFLFVHLETTFIDNANLVCINRFFRVGCDLRNSSLLALVAFLHQRYNDISMRAQETYFVDSFTIYILEHNLAH